MVSASCNSRFVQLGVIVYLQNCYACIKHVYIYVIVITLSSVIADCNLVQRSGEIQKNCLYIHTSRLELYSCRYLHL